MKLIKIYIYISILFLNFSYGQDFCSVRTNTFFASKLLEKEENRLSFRNYGGIGGGGVCWWHSRFQRNATYLANFRPELPRPTHKQVRKIIKNIRKGKKVVTIPGFSDLNSFSMTYQQEIQGLLEKWQLKDGLLKQKWIVGLRGTPSVSATKLKDKMDTLYKYVKLGNIAYQKLQIPGITAHAWLVIDMKKNQDGYVLRVIDSNYIYEVKEFTYTYGDENFIYPYIGIFVPYTEKKKELKKLQRTVERYCDK